MEEGLGREQEGRACQQAGRKGWAGWAGSRDSDSYKRYKEPLQTHQILARTYRHSRPELLLRNIYF